MCSLHSIFVRISLILVVFISSSCTTKQGENDWYVLLMAIPNKIAVQSADVNIISYILTQTHRTLFQRKNDLKYTSEILSEWSRFENGKTFKLCPKVSLKFMDGHFFTAEYLLDFLQAKFSDKQISKIQSNGSCVTIEFSSKREDFFEFLSDLKNAPTLKVRSLDYEFGLGDYDIEKMSGSELSLKRKDFDKNKVNRIVFKKYEDPSSFWVSPERLVDDPNRVSLELIPDEVKSSYRSYRINQLQVALIILNIQNADDRKLIYNCINIEKFRSEFSPDLKEYSDVKTVIPFGMKGGSQGRIDQVCEGRRFIGKRYTFLNWKTASQVRLEKYFKDLERKNGLLVSVKLIGADELLRVAENKMTGDYLTLIGVDSLTGSYSDFYGFFIDKKRNLPQLREPSLFRLFEDLSKAGRSPPIALIAKIEEGLKNGHYVLPIFQPNRTFYYPRKYDVVETDRDSSLQTPNIGLINL